MTEIKPGRELDWAVAEAIDFHANVVVGWTDEFGTRHHCQHSDATLLGGRSPIVEKMRWYDPRFPDNRILNYSTDLNSAFAAANAVGLFTSHALSQESDEWVVATEWVQSAHGAGRAERSRANTPAMAICAAILKLKESEREESPDREKALKEICAHLTETWARYWEALDNGLKDSLKDWIAKPENQEMRLRVLELAETPGLFTVDDAGSAVAHFITLIEGIELAK